MLRIVLARIITEGFDKAKEKALEVLDEMKIELTDAEQKEILTAVSRLGCRILNCWLFSCSVVAVGRILLSFVRQESELLASKEAASIIIEFYIFHFTSGTASFR